MFIRLPLDGGIWKFQMKCYGIFHLSGKFPAMPYAVKCSAQLGWLSISGIGKNKFFVGYTKSSKARLRH